MLPPENLPCNESRSTSCISEIAVRTNDREAEETLHVNHICDMSVMARMMAQGV